MAHYTCNASSHQCSTSSPPISDSCSRESSVHYPEIWKHDILPGRFTLQETVGGGVGRLLSWRCTVISLVVESACLSGSCCFPGHWAQGIYTQNGSSIVEDLPHVEGPPCSDVIFNDGCHVLRRAVTSGWLSSLSPLSSSGSLCLCGAAVRRFLSIPTLWLFY